MSQRTKSLEGEKKLSFKEPTDICVHNNDRWNRGCEMCDALNNLANKNVTLQKLNISDFKLTEEQMKKKYHVTDNDKQSEKLKVTVFPIYNPDGTEDDSDC